MIADLYVKLKALKINIQVVNNQLDIKAPKGVLNSDLLNEIKVHKEEIIAFINSYKVEGKHHMIKKVPDQAGYPLSAAQRRLWILSQSNTGNVAYNLSGTYKMNGALNVDALKSACFSVIERHESLRTVFREDKDGEILQVILSVEEVFSGLREKDLRGEKKQEEALNACLQKDSATAFNLSSSLLSLSLYQLSDSSWVFAYVIHHIINDGWSIGLMINEVMTFYNSTLNNGNVTLAPLRIQYRDFAAWQQEQLGDEGQKDHKKYWLQQFEGELPVLNLPSKNKRPALKTYNGDVYKAHFDADFTNTLKAVCQNLGGTLYMGLLAGISALFYRYTGQEDIIIGSPVAGREHADLENQIGLYANTLALRCRFAGDKTFNQLFGHIKQTVIGAFEHQLFPFDELVESLQLQRDISRNPLFDVQVILQNMAHLNTKQEFNGLEVSGYSGLQRTTSVFDIVFNFAENGDALDLSLVYNSDIYDEQIIAAMVRHFEGLMKAVLKDEQKPLTALEYLEEKEKSTLLSHNKVLKEDNETVISLFYTCLALNPQATAIVSGGRSLNYQQLDEQSDLLCNYLLQTYQPEAETLIGVILDRSDLMIIAMLGIMKAGAVYVPIDTAYPQVRKQFIIEDTGLNILITQTDYIFDLSYYEGQIIALDIQLDTMQPASSPLKHMPEPSALAYVIYTSGSTGQPKGVMVSHAALKNSISGQQHIFDFNTNDRCLQFFSSSFDVSIFEIFSALTVGASLYIAEDETRKSPLLLEEFVCNNELTVITLPAAFIRLLQPENLLSVNKMIIGGEAVSPEKAVKFLPYTRYFNAYGPTETAICATVFEMLPATDTAVALPIGKPIDSTCIYIMDNHGTLLPNHVLGEICIGGNCLARGYYNRPELTAERFVPDPFIIGKRIYKTGDLGRRLADGNIEFMGRKDDQVKVRGYRIEPGEIENVLLQHETISATVVVVFEGAGNDNELAAYFVSNEMLTAAELRDFLAGRLPGHMIPSHFIQLDEFPITQNGKIDKRKLPAPEELIIASGKAYKIPESDIEKHLVAVYEEVLKKQPIGVNDDFFVLGGDSIKSIQIASRLKQKGYTLTIQDILLHPVISDLANHVSINNRTISQDTVEGKISLSPVQQFFFSNKSAEKHHYNQSVLLQSATSIDELGLTAVLDKLLLHHDALRMTYRLLPGGWEQENQGIGQGYLFEILTYHAESFSDECNRIQSGFNLEQGPLFRAALFRAATGDKLLLVAHHLVVDGVSWRILLEDLSSLYEQALSGKSLSLPLKTDSFKYWQEKQEAYASGALLQSELGYWTALSAQPVPHLPLDYPDGSNLVRDIVFRSFSLSAEQSTRLINDCYSAYHTDTNDILLTALSLALSEVFAVEQLLITLEGHGREQIGADVDVTRTVGWFTSFYPVLFDMGYRADIFRQLVEVKEHLHRIPNKGIGYGILHYMGGHDLPLKPEITFNYLGDFGHGVASGDGGSLFTFSSESHGRTVSEHWERTSLLDISGIMAEGRLRLSAGYNTAQYRQGTIDLLMASFECHLVQLIDMLGAAAPGRLTPSDLSYKDLSIEAVGALTASGNVMDAYPLSPLQEGLYYQWLVAPDSNAYFEQMSYEVKGSLDIGLLEKSYQQLVARHGVLRTFFSHEYGTRALQVVQREVVNNFFFLDVCGEEGFSLKAFRDADREQGFNLQEGSQMRLTVLKLEDDLHEFVWSHHHILMDGWCGSILVKEFLQIYYNEMQGTIPVMNKVVPYSDYITWLANLDANISLNFWKQYLADYEVLSSVPGQVWNADPKEFSAANLVFQIDGDRRESLRNYCAKQGVTENIFFQVLWGLLLVKYNDTADVVFGIVVSGRPAELKGIEDMIGLFINTLPVRIRFASGQMVGDLMREAQQSFIKSTGHQHIRLADMQVETTLKTGLFDHMLVYESFPVQEISGQQGGNIQDIALSAVSDIYDQTEHNFSLVIVPGDTITIRIRYNEKAYGNSTIENIKEDILELADLILRSNMLLASDVSSVGESRKKEADLQTESLFNTIINEEF